LGVPQFNGAAGAFAAILGGNSNFVCDDDSAIGTGEENQITSSGADSAQNSFIGGGSLHLITAAESIVGAGFHNLVSGYAAVVSGGYENSASGFYGSVAGGYHNDATAMAAAVGGGSSSSATGSYATIPGGYLNAANGKGSFAAGTRAKARHDGAFVWSDSAGTVTVQAFTCPPTPRVRRV
jgi:hypothetical protein